MNPTTPIRGNYPASVVQTLTPKSTRKPKDDDQSIARLRCDLLEELVTPTSIARVPRRLNLEKEVELSKLDIDQWEKEVRMLAATGNFKEAKNKCQEALKLDKTNAVAIRALSDTYRYSGFLESAKSTIENHFDEEDPVSHRILGDIHYSMKDYDAAIKHYTQAIELDENYYLALRNRSKCYCSQNKYDEALTDVNASLNILPDDSFSLAIRARIFYKSGQFMNTALADCEKAVKKLKILFDDYDGSPVFMKEYLKARVTYINLMIVTCSKELKELDSND